MQYTISQLKHELFGKVYEVYEIFQNFFGEQYTDLQGIPEDSVFLLLLERFQQGDSEGTWLLDEEQKRSIATAFTNSTYVIMVWWPRVTVTNENDRSVEIQDLYAKVDVTLEGRIPYEYRGFKLNRTTFSELQFSCGYLHSHIPSFSDVPYFQNPCLGSGPINNTIMDLKNSFDDTVWMLFCQELSLYVTVESLKGGPYYRMEKIGSKKLMSGYQMYSLEEDFDKCKRNFRNFDTDKLKTIIRDLSMHYLAYGHLSLGYRDGAFVPGMSYFDYMIDISNSTIDFLNKLSSREEVDCLFDNEILVKVLAADGRFYKPKNISTFNLSREGTPMFSFKGEMKCLHIERETEEEEKITVLLCSPIAMLILGSILKIINYRYRNEHNKQIGSDSQAGTSTTYQTVCYI